MPAAQCRPPAGGLALSAGREALPLPTRRGLCRSQAAQYVGFSPTKFDMLVTDGRMPRPKRVDGRVVWDRERLDHAFDLLPDDLPNERQQAQGLENPWDVGG